METWLLLALLQSPAREVLNRFVGDWNVSVEIVRPDRTIESRGRAHGEWTLEGSYVEFRSWTIPAGDSDLQVMTYDRDTGRFQQFLFDSSGYRHQAEGVWDDRSSTLVWTGRGLRIEDRFRGPDRLEWTAVRPNARLEGVVERMQPE